MKLSQLINVARGVAPADLVIKGGQIVNVLSQEIYPADIASVDHSHTAHALSQAGRDVEQMVLARALRLVFEDRVFICGNRTVIFD